MPTLALAQIDINLGNKAANLAQAEDGKHPAGGHHLCHAPGAEREYLSQRIGERRPQTNQQLELL